MDANGCRITRSVATRLLGLALLGAASPGTASATPIWARNLAEPRKGETVEAYFHRALVDHMTHISIPESVRARGLHLDSAGLLPDSAFVEYLRWRESIHVERFDANHPRVAALLHKDAAARALRVRASELPGCTCDCPHASGTKSAPPTLVGPEVVIPPPRVPEPASAIVALAMVGSAAVARRRGRRA